MKKITRLSLASALMAAGLLGNVPAFASDTASVTVNATLAAACKFSGTPKAIDMTLDPTDSAGASGTTDVSFWCTKGTGFNLGVQNSSSLTLKKASLAPIPYSASFPEGNTGTGAGANQGTSKKVKVSVAFSAYADATPDTYSDTLVVIFNP